jgi:hypothetical protein
MTTEPGGAPLKLARVIQTSLACPSQWDAWGADGDYYYLRYRHGHGSVRQYKSRDWVTAAEDELIRQVTSFDYGHPLDGAISLDEFAALAGITIVPDVMVTGFGDYLRDELVLGGVIPLAGEE